MLNKITTLKTTYESLFETLELLEEEGVLSFIDCSESVEQDGTSCHYGFWIDIYDSEDENVEELYFFLSGHCQWSSCQNSPSEIMEIDGVEIAWNLEEDEA